MENLKLCDSDYRFMSLLWDHAPLGSGQLVALAEERLGWKKSTTYTVLKKLCERGFAQNTDSMVTVLISREQIQMFESQRVVERSFGGSLPSFLVSFLGNSKLSEQEAQELMELIHQHKEA